MDNYWPRDHMYCWSLHQHSFQTNKWILFLDTEAAFPYCNRSIKISLVIWCGSRCGKMIAEYVNNWQRSICLPFLSLCISMNFSKTITYFFVISNKITCIGKYQVSASMICITIGAKLRKYHTLFVSSRFAENLRG